MSDSAAATAAAVGSGGDGAAAAAAAWTSCSPAGCSAEPLRIKPSTAVSYGLLPLPPPPPPPPPLPPLSSGEIKPALRT